MVKVTLCMIYNPPTTYPLGCKSSLLYQYIVMKVLLSNLVVYRQRCQLTSLASLLTMLFQFPSVKYSVFHESHATEPSWLCLYFKQNSGVIMCLFSRTLLYYSNRKDRETNKLMASQNHGSLYNFGYSKLGELWWLFLRKLVVISRYV